MALTNATIYPVYGQAYRFSVPIKGSAGNPSTGGLTSLDVYIAKDNATTLASASGSAAERGTTGWVDVDLDATDMAATQIIGEVRATDADIVYACFEVKPMVLTDPEERVLDATIVKPEGLWAQTWRRLFNKTTVDSDAGTITVYADDSATASVTGTVSKTATAATSGKLS